MITDGESALMIACSLPLILIGRLRVPAFTLSTRSVYVPSARRMMSPAPAAISASGRLNTLEDELYPEDADHSPVGDTLRVSALAWCNRVLNRSNDGSSNRSS